MTQKQIVLEYIKLHGSILPAKMSGEIFQGYMIGSEVGKRCRELRQSGYLYSVKEGKFERFFKSKEIVGIIEKEPAQALFQQDNYFV